MRLWWWCLWMACGSPLGADGDGDGASADDCAPADASVFPGADDELDGVDQNCDGVDGVDADGDGVPANRGADCDDHEPAVARGFEEVPHDGLDNDCDCGDDMDADDDGFEGAASGGTDCADDDASLYPGVPAHTARCAPANDADQDGVGSSADCDDGDPAVAPGAAEVPFNGADDDCDGGEQLVVSDPSGVFGLHEVPVAGTLHVWVRTSDGSRYEGVLGPTPVAPCEGFAAMFLYNQTGPAEITFEDFVPATGSVVVVRYEPKPPG